MLYKINLQYIETLILEYVNCNVILTGVNMFLHEVLHKWKVANLQGIVL